MIILENIDQTNYKNINLKTYYNNLVSITNLGKYLPN